MNRLKEKRFFKRINQYELANLSGVHQSRISLIENDYVVGTPGEQERLAEALGTTVGEIFPPEENVRLVAARRKEA